MSHKPYEVWKRQQDRRKRNAITFRLRPICKTCGKRPARWMVGTADERAELSQGWEKREDLAWLCGRCRYKMGGNVAKMTTHPLPSLSALQIKMITAMTAEAAQWIAKYADDWGISRNEVVRQAIACFRQHEEDQDEREKEKSDAQEVDRRKTGIGKIEREFDKWYDSSIEGN